MLSRSFYRRAPKIGISTAALASAEAKLMNNASSTSASTHPSNSKASRLASAEAIVDKFSSGGGKGLDLGLDFSKMDFKKIAEDTQQAIHRERIQLPKAAGTNRNVSSSSSAVGSANPAERFSQSSGATTSTAGRHASTDIPRGMTGSFRSNIGATPVIDKLRDFKLTNDWEGALGYFTTAVGNPNEYRKWHIQHIRLMVDLLSVHGKMSELWKVWRLARATNKLDDVNEASGNNFIFRFGRPSLLKAVVEDVQLSTWWVQLVRDAMKLLESHALPLDPKNEPTIKIALSGAAPQEAIKAHLRQFEEDKAQRQGDVRRAAREAFHQQVMNVVRDGGHRQSNVDTNDPSKQETEGDALAQAPTRVINDPRDIYELNEALAYANSLVEVDRLLILARKRGIEANDDTYARRIQRLGLKRRDAFRKQREGWTRSSEDESGEVTSPGEGPDVPSATSSSTTPEQNNNQRRPHPDRSDEHVALDLEILFDAKKLFHEANIHAKRYHIRLFDPSITDGSAISPEELLGMTGLPAATTESSKSSESVPQNSGSLPSTSLCNALLYELRKSSSFHDLRLMEALMRGPDALVPQQGKFWRISPSSKTVDHLISAYYRAGHTEKCKELFDEMKVNYAARLSPLVYTTMIKIQSAETAPRRAENGELVFPERIPSGKGLSPRMQAINAHQEMNQLIHQLAADGADKKLNDSTNIALINKWAQTRRRR